MEDEVVYSSVVFKGFDDSKPKVAAEPAEEAVYSEVKKSGGAPTQNSSETPGESTDALFEETAASRAASYRRATTFLGVLCVLLLAGVVGMSVLNIIHSSQNSNVLVRKLQQLNATHTNSLMLMNLTMAASDQLLRALNRNLTNDNRLLQALYKNESTALRKMQAEKEALEKEKEELATQRNQLNNTLRTITQMKNFQSHAFCQLTNGVIHCEPCMKNWIQNGSSCYFFYNELYWRTWKASQETCNEMGGDLAVIDNREEQEFIMLHTPVYYDEYHGYWIGLSKTSNNWVWTTGNTLENGFWIAPPRTSDGTCVMTKPTRNARESWQAATCSMNNKYVCEMSVVDWPSII